MALFVGLGIPAHEDVDVVGESFRIAERQPEHQLHHLLALDPRELRREPPIEQSDAVRVLVAFDVKNVPRVRVTVKERVVRFREQHVVGERVAQPAREDGAVGGDRPQTRP